MNEDARPNILQRAIAAVSVYLERQVIVVTLLGFSSGLPLALSTSTLLVWMADEGVNLTTIGLYSLAGLPYTLKFLWAPFVDAWRVPLLSRLLGRRRGWLVLTQLLLFIAILALGSVDPVVSPWLVALAAVCLTTISATQDIVIDAYRVESLTANEQAAGMGGYVAAYRIALLVSSAGVIALVGSLEANGWSGPLWAYGYTAAAGLVIVGVIGVLLGREPQAPPTEEPAADAPAAARPLVVAFGAFADFLKMPLAPAVLLFVLLFRFCDAFAGVMTGPFVIDIGFDKQTYAAVVKGLGTAAAIGGGLVGGLIAKMTPLSISLWIAGILQMATNLVFSWLAMQGVDTGALAIAITVENAAGGIATVIFVAYLSSLCQNPLHTATQFALLTALASTGRTVLSASAGAVADVTGWVAFFGVSALIGLPALALLAWLQARGHFAPVESADHNGRRALTAAARVPSSR